MKPPLSLIVKPSPLPGMISVNKEFLAALKEENARGESKMADAFKEMINKARSVAREGRYEFP